jgi:thiol-disulfide isomerase/thioredoxin
MRIDPKYFNLFIGICAALTVLIIFYSTLRYSQNQISDFEETVSEFDFYQVSFKSFSQPDSVHFVQLIQEERPLIILFWSTWSGKSIEVIHFLDGYASENPELKIIAAAVRDSEEYIQSYISENDYDFHFVEGTDFYHSMMVPGMPAQIMFRADGSLFSSHVGDHLNSLKNELDNLMKNER